MRLLTSCFWRQIFLKLISDAEIQLSRETHANKQKQEAVNNLSLIYGWKIVVRIYKQIRHLVQLLKIKSSIECSRGNLEWSICYFNAALSAASVCLRFRHGTQGADAFRLKVKNVVRSEYKKGICLDSACLTRTFDIHTRRTPEQTRDVWLFLSDSSRIYTWQPEVSFAWLPAAAGNRTGAFGIIEKRSVGELLFDELPLYYSSI
jgi:hypothetical protein